MLFVAVDVGGGVEAAEVEVVESAPEESDGYDDAEGRMVVRKM